VEQAHAQGVQVLVSVGGWGYDAEFEKLAADPQTRTTFVTGLVNYAEEYNLDGLDIDWEYPDPGTSSQNFLVLMQELRAALPPSKLLTAAIVALGETGQGIPFELFPLVDFLNIMAYDGSDTDHSSYTFAQNALAYWNQRGLPVEKTVLGVPFYARPNWVPYRKLVDADPTAAQSDTVTYMGQMVYYNGIPTMRQKTQLALENASGVMIWTVSYDTADTTSLLTAIFDKVQTENH
jgi:GH18 family chitinase